MGVGRFSSALGGLGGVIASSVLPALGSMLTMLTALGPASLIIIGAVAAIGLLAYAYHSNLFNIKDVMDFVGSNIVAFFTKTLPNALSYTGKLITEFTLSVINAFTSFGSFIIGLFTQSIPQAITQFISTLPNFVSYVTAQISNIINTVNNAVNSLLGLMGIKIGATPSISASGSGSIKAYSSSTSSSASKSSSPSSSSSSKSSAGGLSVKGAAIPLQHGIETIVNKPTLFLAGEAGAEYVYVKPLHRLNSSMSTNAANAHNSIVININVGSLIGSDRVAVKQLADIICNEIADRIGIFHF